MKISIQGNLGSYSHIAANYLFGKDIEIIERDNFTDVFEDLKSDNANYIVVPIENSTHGSVYQNYDNLTNYGYEVIGEVYLKINFHLIGNLESKVEYISEIFTHPVGMNQIRGFLRENPMIKPSEYHDTAGSVAFIKNKGNHLAAAASKFAAEIYEMKVLKENIQENSKNYTRFFVLSKNQDKSETDIFQNVSTDKKKTTIQFVLGEEAGSLYKSLRCFADRGISLSKIESRPIINTDWKYRFYLDIEESADSNKLQNALTEMKDYIKEFQVLGSYFKGEYIET